MRLLFSCSYGFRVRVELISAARETVYDSVSRFTTCTMSSVVSAVAGLLHNDPLEQPGQLESMTISYYPAI